MNFNQDAWRLVEEKVKSEIAKSLKTVSAGSGSSLPSKADFIGQQFVLAGAESGNGLYVSTGTTTPGWKAVSHAN